VPVRAAAHRCARILPALVLGGAPLAIGLTIGSGLIVLWALFFLLECFADIAVLFAIRNVPANALVLDTWDRIGCRVDDREDISSPRFRDRIE